VTGEVQWVWDVPPGCTALLARAGHTLVGARFPLAEDSGLYRLDTATGDLAQLLSDNVWSLHRGDVADLVSCGTYGSPESAFVLALDPRSGEPLWRQPAMTELVAVDGPDVACAENTGGVQQVVLRDAATGAEIWRTEPRDLEYAGLVFFTGDAVGVVEDDGLWFTDRATGADLGVVDVEDMWTSALTVTPAGIVLALGDGLGLLRPPA
jgi:outer membrane protein assembly factor BamB